GLLGLALVLAGAASVRWSHDLRPDEAAVEERVQHGPGHSRREMFLRLGMGAAALSTVGVGVSAARRIDRSVAALRATRWEDGAEIVDSDGEPVVLDRISDGEILTVYPRGA